MTIRATNPDRDSALQVRHLADQAFCRAAGAPLVAGNCIRLLKDADQNYPAWLEAIRSARRLILFDSYIVHEDEVGYAFADALIAKARQGATVRLIYDWLGALNATSRRFWKRLQAGGVQVRCFNPPQLARPFGWVSRDHRKMLAVDGHVGFVTGLCVGRMWVGDAQRGRDPWRDTGVEVRGPAVAGIERAFAEVWAMIGEPIPEIELTPATSMPEAGETTCELSQPCRARRVYSAWTSLCAHWQGRVCGSPMLTTLERRPMCRH